MRDIIQLLIDLENPITSVPIYGGWIEIDTVNDLNSYFSKKIVQKII